MIKGTPAGIEESESQRNGMRGPLRPAMGCRITWCVLACQEAYVGVACAGDVGGCHGGRSRLESDNQGKGRRR